MRRRVLWCFLAILLIAFAAYILFLHSQQLPDGAGYSSGEMNSSRPVSTSEEKILKAADRLSTAKKDKSVDPAEIQALREQLKREIRKSLLEVYGWRKKTLGFEHDSGGYPANSEEFEAAVARFNRLVWRNEEAFMLFIEIIEEEPDEDVRKVARWYLNKCYASAHHLDPIFSMATMDTLVNKMLSTTDIQLRSIITRAVNQTFGVSVRSGEWENYLIKGPDDPRVVISRDAAQKLIDFALKSIPRVEEEGNPLLDSDVRRILPTLIEYARFYDEVADFCHRLCTDTSMEPYLREWGLDGLQSLQADDQRLLDLFSNITGDDTDPSLQEHAVWRCFKGIELDRPELFIATLGDLYYRTSNGNLKERILDRFINMDSPKPAVIGYMEDGFVGPNALDDSSKVGLLRKMYFLSTMDAYTGGTESTPLLKEKRDLLERMTRSTLLSDPARVYAFAAVMALSVDADKREESSETVNEILSVMRRDTSKMVVEASSVIEDGFKEFLQTGCVPDDLDEKLEEVIGE